MYFWLLQTTQLVTGIVDSPIRWIVRFLLGNNIYVYTVIAVHDIIIIRHVWCNHVLYIGSLFFIIFMQIKRHFLLFHYSMLVKLPISLYIFCNNCIISTSPKYIVIMESLRHSGKKSAVLIDEHNLERNQRNTTLSTQRNRVNVSTVNEDDYNYKVLQTWWSLSPLLTM